MTVINITTAVFLDLFLHLRWLRYIIEKCVRVYRTQLNFRSPALPKSLWLSSQGRKNKNLKN
jgi:hypothetical protein